MTAAWGWIKWAALGVIGVLLAAAGILAALLRAERTALRLSEARNKALRAAIKARQTRDVADAAAEAVADAEHTATADEHAATVAGPEALAGRLDIADEDAELEEVNKWIRSQKF